MKRLKGLLLGIAVLVPVAAHAQQQRLQRIEDQTEGARPLTPEERQIRRAERAARRADRLRTADPSGGLGDARPVRRLDGDGMRHARPDGVHPRPDQQILPPRPNERRGGMTSLRDRPGARLGYGGFQEARPAWYADRGPNAVGEDWGRDAYRGGQVWNRGWRNDRRYAWDRDRRSGAGLFRLPRYYPPSGLRYEYRRFPLGSAPPRSLFARTYWLEDASAYRLPDAYGPYRWIRYFDDALLIDLRSGRVLDAVYDIFG